MVGELVSKHHPKPQCTSYIPSYSNGSKNHHQHHPGIQHHHHPPSPVWRPHTFHAHTGPVSGGALRGILLRSESIDAFSTTERLLSEASLGAELRESAFRGSIELGARRSDPAHLVCFKGFQEATPVLRRSCRADVYICLLHIYLQMRVSCGDFKPQAAIPLLTLINSFNLGIDPHNRTNLHKDELYMSNIVHQEAKRTLMID